MAQISLTALLSQLTVEEKAALLDGSDFWRTTPVERLDIPAVMLSDGPHGLRKQAEGGDHAGLTDSVPATCFPLLAFAMLSLTLNAGLALGVAYGIWAATGVALTAIASKFLFGEPFTKVMAGGIALVIAGVLMIELGAAH